MDNVFILKRMIAGSIVVLMLAVSAVAAACDLACGFAEAQADCHSARITTGNSSDAYVEMSGMSGMTMPDELNAGRAAISSALDMEMHHARIGQMGPCERQFCNDEGAAYISRSVRRDAPALRIGLAVECLPRMGPIYAGFYDARDGIARFRSGDRVPLRILLRV
jgi:hypothetical protein